MAGLNDISNAANSQGDRPTVFGQVARAGQQVWNTIGNIGLHTVYGQNALSMDTNIPAPQIHKNDRTPVASFPSFTRWSPSSSNQNTPDQGYFFGLN